MAAWVHKSLPERSRYRLYVGEESDVYVCGWNAYGQMNNFTLQIAGIDTEGY